jgi:hypothetical protein
MEKHLIKRRSNCWRVLIKETAKEMTTKLRGKMNGEFLGLSPNYAKCAVP